MLNIIKIVNLQKRKGKRKLKITGKKYFEVGVEQKEKTGEREEKN